MYTGNVLQYIIFIMFYNKNMKFNQVTYNYKQSVLRRQSRDTNPNIKRSVYCQYR